MSHSVGLYIGFDNTPIRYDIGISAELVDAIHQSSENLGLITQYPLTYTASESTDFVTNSKGVPFHREDGTPLYKYHNIRFDAAGAVARNVFAAQYSSLVIV